MQIGGHHRVEVTKNRGTLDLSHEHFPSDGPQTSEAEETTTGVSET